LDERSVLAASAPHGVAYAHRAVHRASVAQPAIGGARACAGTSGHHATVPRRLRRNANLDVFRALLARELPSGSVATGIDIGCGEGETARILHAHDVGSVVGVDPHEPSIDEARRIGGDGVTYVHADALHVELPQADVVTSVAMLHHVDMVGGLRVMASLVAPGGLLLVVGLAKSTYPRDLLYDVAGSVAVRLHRSWHTTAPMVWPPPVTYAEARRIAEYVLPGVRYRREIRLRYSLAWRQTLV
jgi:SAM-dependent methyltransferase